MHQLVLYPYVHLMMVLQIILPNWSKPNLVLETVWLGHIPDRPQQIPESPLHMITWLFLLTSAYIEAYIKYRRRLSSHAPPSSRWKTTQFNIFVTIAGLLWKLIFYAVQFSTATNQASGGLVWRGLVNKESELWEQSTPQVWLKN